MLIARIDGDACDRLVAVLRTDTVADFEAVNPRQHHVEQDQVEAPAQRHFEPFGAVDGPVHLVAVVHEDID